jgi:molybdate transport system regulatory protein
MATHLKFAIRIMHHDHIAFGPGKADLLEAIMQQGSISAAAKHMQMSYKRAWDLVTVMNGAFQGPLVATAIGGSHGGGAHLTALGQEVLQQYRALQVKAAAAIERESQALTKLLA